MNISNRHSCFGCGVCAIVCPRNIIEIKLNKEGFYVPQIIDENCCVQCGLCVDVCAYEYQNLSLRTVPVKAWACWSNDSQTRQSCSSGGIGFEISRQLMTKGYNVVGCKYNSIEQRAEHYIATTIEELRLSIGSKYIQSYTEKAFRQIDRKKQYLVTGTPCQIDSFRRMIQKFKCEDNFVLMDFYCHCVPSIHAWKNYIKMLETRVGRVESVSWRNKSDYGWHDSWNILACGENGTIESRKSQGDWFYKMFLGHYCIGEQCQWACKYKYDKSSADIRIGDLWGTTYSENEDGVSALVSFTERGQQIIESLGNVTLVEHPLSVVSEGQMRCNAKSVPLASFVMLLFSHKIYPTLWQWNLIFRFLDKPFRGFYKIMRLLGLKNENRNRHNA